MAMRIVKFVGKNVHGYLNFNIKFNAELTFLTGINGSGKTTALNCIASLLLPDFEYLCKTQHDLMEIQLNSDGGNFKIKSNSNNEGAILRISGIADPLQIQKHEIDPDKWTPRHESIEREFYQEQYLSYRSTDLISALNRLPNPMFLGLDRRTLHGSVGPSAPSSYAAARYRHNRKHSTSLRTKFSGNMEIRLWEAMGLAEQSQSEQQSQLNRLGQEFQTNLLVELLHIEPKREQTLDLPDFPKQSEIRNWLGGLNALPQMFQVNQDKIVESVRPMKEYLDYIIEFSAEYRTHIRKNEKIRQKWIEENTTEIFNWMLNVPSISKIQRIVNIIQDYNKRRSAVREKNDRYLRILNSFYREGGKDFYFNEFGEAGFRSTIKGSEIEIQSLSSGEIQIFVMLTHLYFNPEISRGNVFMVDEPELSLHVSWQERFVESIMSASQGVQIILATHSPSIILEKVNSCIEVNQK